MNVEIERFDPDTGKHWLAAYTVDTTQRSMTVMDVLDYIFEHLDPTLAYYKHSACNHGICGRCVVSVNGAVRLACVERVDQYAQLHLAPASARTCVRDLVVR